MATGDLFLVDSTTDRIYRKAGGFRGSFWDAGITLPTGVTAPSDIAFDRGGNLYVVHRVGSLSTSRIYRRSGGYVGASWDSGIQGPTHTLEGIAFDSDDNLYAVSSSGDRIYRKTGGYDGSLAWDAGITLPSGASSPSGIAFDSQGDLYLVDFSTDRVYRRAGGYDGASWDSGIQVRNPPEGTPRGIAFDSIDDLYLVGSSSDRIFRRPGGYDGTDWDSGQGLPSAWATPEGIAFHTRLALSLQSGRPRLSMAAKSIGGVGAPDPVTDLTARQTRTITTQQNVSLTNTSVIIDWWTYFFAELGLSDAVLEPHLPVTAEGDHLSIEMVGGPDLACGQIIVGLCTTIGEVQVGDTGLDGLDFSHVETNIYGDLVTVERAATQVHRFDVFMRVGQISEFVQVMDRLRGGKRALWIGDPDIGVRAWSYGFARDWNIYYQDGVFARARLTIQGVV